MTLTETIQNALVGSTLGAFIAGAIVLSILILAGIWIYTSLAWMTIGKKLRYKNSYLAWIPFARTGMVLELGKFHWAWAFLWLIPILGWIVIAVLGLIARWRIFEARNYSGWLSLSIILPYIGGILYLVAIGFVAWEDQRKRR